MKVLADSCEALEKALSEASQQCQAIQHVVNEFTINVTTLPLTTVKLRLSAIACQIMIWAWSLRTHHDGKGSVFVMITQTGLGVHWAENEYSAEDKDWFKARGLLIVSPEAVNAAIEHLIKRLGSGEWAEVVAWINRYGTSLVCDASEFA